MGTPEVIVTDEYQYYQELARFGCPWKRDYRDCWLNKVCPDRPDPCDNCPARAEFAWTFKKLQQNEIDRAYKKLEKACSSCSLWQDYAEDQTYRTACDEMRHAKLILGCITEGQIKVHINAEGWEVPL